MPLTIFAIVSPTPAAVNTEPRHARSMDSMLRGPTVEIMRSASFIITFGLFDGRSTIKIIADARTPNPTPTSAPKSVNTANIRAPTPITNAGMNTFIPILSKLAFVSSAVIF